jgi:beta-lactamase regulating signal transducer with metallopeptidase domain
MSAQTIGWTLIHSLWQGLAIYVILKIAYQFTNRSDVRYGLGVTALGLLLASSTATLFILSYRPASEGFQLVINAGQVTTVSSSSVLDFVNQNIIWLIRFWMLGFVVGLLRIAAGLWYIGRLRRNAYPVQDEWMDMVKRLSESLNVNRVVAMAEAGISSPMVVGFMKPIILFPVGLLSGLSTEQVETILVHELSHIRRQDYIINLVQSVIETIFFFNPFALLISSLIREERENCCDDMVIARGISPISYVRTLAQLEASRSVPAGKQGSSTLALGFAGNQNQLLNRIKRIMENSAKNDWGKSRLVPFALLFLGLVCASWLSISTETESVETRSAHKVIAQDTSREDGLRVIKRGTRHDGWVVEPLPAHEPVADVDIAAFDEVLPIPEIAFDSIPDDYTYTLRLRDPEGIAEFEKEFTMKFKENFKEFYEKNKDQVDQMMKDAWNSAGKRKVTEDWHRDAAEEVDLADMHRIPDLERIISPDMIQIMKQADMMTHQIEVMDARRALELSQEMLAIEKQQMDIMNEQFLKQELIFDDMARRSDDYTKELTRLLGEDGYLKKGEDLGDLHINDMNGEMNINGKKIKEKDAIKYRALRDSYFQDYKRRSTPGRNE